MGDWTCSSSCSPSFFETFLLDNEARTNKNAWWDGQNKSMSIVGWYPHWSEKIIEEKINLAGPRYPIQVIPVKSDKANHQNNPRKHKDKHIHKYIGDIHIHIHIYIYTHHDSGGFCNIVLPFPDVNPLHVKNLLAQFFFLHI
jgi:hypothetical protein